MFIAGHETTVSQLECGFVALFNDDDQLARLRKDPSLAASAVEEILRMYPLNPHGVFRYATEDLEIGGVLIPAGSVVLVGAAVAAFDADRFEDAAQFDVSRERNPHLSFGHGPHYCIGAPLARLELETVFGTIFQRFPDLSLAVPPAELTPRISLAGGFEALPVTW
jgi:cytochrome P450